MRSSDCSADVCSSDLLGAAVAPGGSPGSFAVTACFEVAPFNATTNATSPTIYATAVSQATTMKRGTANFNTPACDLLPLQFNGSVVKVFTFNPAGNTTQESFARVTNWGNTGGKVTVEGWDDSGAPAAGNVTFTLGPGQPLHTRTIVREGKGG